MTTNPDKPRLVAAGEIAAIMGLSRQRVQQLAERRDFPEPLATLSCGRIWDADDIEHWYTEYRARTNYTRNPR